MTFREVLAVILAAVAVVSAGVYFVGTWKEKAGMIRWGATVMMFSAFFLCICWHG